MDLMFEISVIEKKKTIQKQQTYKRRIDLLFDDAVRVRVRVSQQRVQTDKSAGNPPG